MGILEGVLRYTKRCIKGYLFKGKCRDFMGCIG